MNKAKVTQTNAGNSSPIDLHDLIGSGSPASPLGIEVKLVSGTPTSFKVQYTYDDVDLASPVWSDVSGFTGLTATTVGKIDYPVMALRVVVVGTGVVDLQVLMP